MMFYKIMKAMVHSPDSDSDFFDIGSGGYQRDTFAPYLFILCSDNKLRTSRDLIKENGFIF